MGLTKLDNLPLPDSVALGVEEDPSTMDNEVWTSLELGFFGVVRTEIAAVGRVGDHVLTILRVRRGFGESVEVVGVSGRSRVEKGWGGREVDVSSHSRSPGRPGSSAPSGSGCPVTCIETGT